MEIVTWVLEGELDHRDSAGHHGVLYPGLAQRMSAGSGIRHSEMNASTTMPVHFIQMWVVPDTASTQVISRDRHADYVQILALVGASLDRFSTEIRNLQRSSPVTD